MSYSKKSLAEAKEKLYKKDPNFFSKKKPVKKNVDRSNLKKKVVIWNYKVNDIVICINTKKVGLIVSNNQYFNKKVEENYYFVLFGNKVQKYNGKRLRKP